ncbi:MAG: hypothetical protein IT373_38465 [Polyangiaceae bacterium]|nr:hypothetical protein [Polyangiaceae bacterium]
MLGWRWAAVALLLAGCDERRDKPEIRPMQPPPVVAEPRVPPEELVATGPTPPLVRRSAERALEIPEGPERRAYELAATGQVAEAEKLGADATLGLILAARSGLREDLPKRLPLYAALGRVGDERAIQALAPLYAYDSEAHEKAYVGALAAVWSRLAAHAEGTRKKPTVVLRWYVFECWRPKRFAIERELDRRLAEAGIDKAPPDARSFDGILMLEYREREGDEYTLRLGSGTGTAFRLGIDVVSLAKRAVVPVAITGGLPAELHVGAPKGMTRDDELYDLALDDFRASMKTAGQAVAAALR